MKFLILAYGDEAGWKKLSKAEQQEVLAQDEVMKARGDLVAAVRPSTVVRAPKKVRTVEAGPFLKGGLPMAGFGVIEAANLDEAIELVSNTPCARADGAVEIWPVWDLSSSGAIED